MEYGLVLAGGGVRGAYHVGVWRALRRLRIKISAVTGASIGAVNAAFVAQGDLALLEDLWRNINAKDIVSLPDNLEVGDNLLRITNLAKMARHIYKSAGLDVSPLEEILRARISERKVRASSMDFGITTYSLTDREEKSLFCADIPHGELIDYIMASACFPLFKTRVIGSERFIDGGVTNNMPVDMLLSRGINNIITVDVRGVGVNKSCNTAGANIISIRDKRAETGTLDFNREGIEKSIEEGYFDTLKAFCRCMGEEYSFDAADYCRARRRYSADILSGLESGAKIFGVDKLRIYTVEELANLTVRAYLDFAARRADNDYKILEKLQLFEPERVTASLVRVLESGGSEFVKEHLSLFGSKYDAAAAILYFKQGK